MINYGDGSREWKIGGVDYTEFNLGIFWPIPAKTAAAVARADIWNALRFASSRVHSQAEWGKRIGRVHFIKLSAEWFDF